MNYDITHNLEVSTAEALRSKGYALTRSCPGWEVYKLTSDGKGWVGNTRMFSRRLEDFEALMSS